MKDYKILSKGLIMGITLPLTFLAGLTIGWRSPRPEKEFFPKQYSEWRADLHQRVDASDDVIGMPFVSVNSEPFTSGDQIYEFTAEKIDPSKLRIKLLGNHNDLYAKLSDLDGRPDSRAAYSLQNKKIEYSRKSFEVVDANKDGLPDILVRDDKKEQTFLGSRAWDEFGRDLFTFKNNIFGQ